MIDNPLNRNLVKRGSQLPWAKLNEDDIRLIRSLIDHRDNLKRELHTLTNAAIAEKFGVHVRTIDRISTGENWGHVQ